MQPRKRRGGRPGARRSKPWFVQYRLPNGRQRSPGFATYGDALAFCDAQAERLRGEHERVLRMPEGELGNLGTELRALTRACRELIATMNEDRTALEQRFTALERRIDRLTADS